MKKFIMVKHQSRNQTSWSIFGILFLFSITASVYASGAHNKPNTPKNISLQKQKNHDEGLIEISIQGQKAAGIKTQLLKPKSIPIYLSAPGEVIPNMNKSSIVTPRIKSQVVERLIQVGMHVKKGQVLVRLSSVIMSQAQGNLILTLQEWLRVKALGKQAISAKRYQTADVAYQQAYSKLLAYGMSIKQIDRFIASREKNKANGNFVLLAPQEGTIFSANFKQGQMINQGQTLYEIVDESSLWIDAKISSAETAIIKNGAMAIIETSKSKLSAKVYQVHHKLDEVTRTRIIRLVVKNPNDEVHPGEFVTVSIQVDKTSPVLAVDKTALMRTADGDEAVYIEVKPNHFKQQEVTILKKIGSWRVLDGLKYGVRIVIRGAFFVHSESLKSGFTVHNH